MSEYAQTTQNNVNEHEYASDNKVIIAFVTSHWNLYDSKGRLMTVHSLDDQADLSKKMKLMIRIQKNCPDCQSIIFVLDNKHPHILQVRATIVFTCVPNVLVNWMISQWVSLSTIKAL